MKRRRSVFMREQKYILLGHDPIPCSNLAQWAASFGDHASRIVAKTAVACDTGEVVEVSTVFLGLDHNYMGVGEPILFETMTFGGLLNGWQWRYCTWEEAEAGHAEVLQIVRRAEVLGEGTADELHARELAAQVISRAFGKGLG